MNKLKIRHGKFYRDGILVPMEIGNAEQIKLLNWTNELIKELAGDGIVPKFYQPDGNGFEFPCPCGESLRGEWRPGASIDCHFCYRKFFMNTDQDEIPVIKSKP